MFTKKFLGFFVVVVVAGNILSLCNNYIYVIILYDCKVLNSIITNYAYKIYIYLLYQYCIIYYINVCQITIETTLIFSHHT